MTTVRSQLCLGLHCASTPPARLSSFYHDWSCTCIHKIVATHASILQLFQGHLYNQQPNLGPWAIPAWAPPNLVGRQLLPHDPGVPCACSAGMPYSILRPHDCKHVSRRFVAHRNLGLQEKILTLFLHEVIFDTVPWLLWGCGFLFQRKKVQI